MARSPDTVPCSNKLAAVAWWFHYHLHGRDLSMDPKTHRGSFEFQTFINEKTVSYSSIRQVEIEILRLLGGAVAEYLFCGSHPKKAIRFSNEYRNPASV